MIKGKDKISEYLRFNNTPYWKLFHINGATLISEMNDYEALTIEGSIAKLDSLLEVLGPGQYSLEAWETKDQKKLRKKVQFEIYSDQNQQFQQQQAAVSGFAGVGSISDQMKEMVDKALNDYKKDQKIESLEAEVKRLQAENRSLAANSDSAGLRILEKISPAIKYFFPEGSTVPAVSGTGVMDVEEAQNRLENAFEKWGKFENNYVEIIEKIATMPEEDGGSEKYKMARNYLLTGNMF